MEKHRFLQEKKQLVIINVHFLTCILSILDGAQLPILLCICFSLFNACIVNSFWASMDVTPASFAVNDRYSLL